MPRIKRWFPVSHDINHSPTVRILVRDFGAPGLRIWLEILSIADRAGPLIDCCSDGAIRRLTSAAETRFGVTRQVLEALSKAGSIEHEGCFIVGSCELHATMKAGSCSIHSPMNHFTEVVNYWEYHRTEERKPLPPDQTRPDQTRLNLKNDETRLKPPDKKPATPEPTADLKKTEPEPPEPGPVRKLDPEIKAAADRIYAIDRQKYSRLVVWIKQAEKGHWAKAVIVKALTDFLPYAAEVDQWWPYLDKIIYKADQVINAAAHAEEHYKQKEADRLYSINLRR